MKISASFITYFPDPVRFDAAYKSVASQVDNVIVIDNTVHNEGISKALNRAFEKAEADGYDWLITFDQDSVAPEGLVERLKADIAGMDNVGQIGPSYSNRKNSGKAVEEASHIITSRSLTNIAAWRAAGGFREEYFIDNVDIEFSIRLRLKGYKVLIDQGICMDHQLGKGIKGIPLFGKLRLQYVDYPPIRWYYIVRNTLQMEKEYKNLCPKFVSGHLVWLRKKCLRMLLSGDNKAEKLKMIYKGWQDFRKGKMGPYESNTVVK